MMTTPKNAEIKRERKWVNRKHEDNKAAKVFSFIIRDKDD